ncbi:hypothetical protein BGZ75_000091 [Mortierella antarctica]|nr:hypothetical protein BGZ75_000091 [Mortierella antarctica]
MPSSSRYSLTDLDDDLPYSEAETDYHSVAQDPEEDSDDFEEYEEKPPQIRVTVPFYRRRAVILGCCLLTTLFLAIFVPLLIYVIIPKIAQLMLNSATMDIKQINMTNPTETSIGLSIDAQVGNIIKIVSAELQFTEDIQVHWQGQLIGSMSLDAVHVKSGKGAIAQTTDFTILNTTAFSAFVSDLLSSKTFSWTLKSKATLRALGRTIKDLKVDKVLPMNGLDRLAGLKLLRFNLPGASPEGALLDITASVANPSPVGLSLGTLTLDLNFQSTYLGRVVANNVQLVGGEPAILNITGTLLKQTDPAKLQDMSLLFSNYLASIPTLATAQGVSVLPDGKNQISWLTSAFLSTKLVMPFAPPQPLNVIQEFTIHDMNFVMRPDSPWAPTVNSNSVSTVFKLPFDITVNVLEVSNTTMTLVHEGIHVADITSGVWNQTLSDMPNNKMVFTLPPTPLYIKDDAHDAFSALLNNLLQNTDPQLDIAGGADAVASTPMGVVRLRVPIKSTLTVKGIGFATIAPTINNVSIIAGNTESVSISANVMIENPSVFSVDAGEVKLTVAGTVAGVTGVLGVATLNFKFAPGQNALAAALEFKPTDPSLRDKFFTAFVEGGVFDCTFSGDESSSPISSLGPVLKSLIMKAKIPSSIAPGTNLITHAVSTPSIGGVLGNRQIPLVCTVKNPVQTPFSINDADAEILWQGQHMGYVKGALDFNVPVGQSADSRSLVLQAPLGFQFGVWMVTTFLVSNIGVLTGVEMNLQMKALLAVSVGGPRGVGYFSNLTVYQEAIPTFVKLDYSFVGALKKRSEQSNLTALLRPEPSRESGMEYVAWLKEALFAAYPEEAKQYVADLNAY